MLSDKQIKAGIDNKSILITPFREEAMNPNSYDLRIDSTMGMYIPNHYNEAFVEKLEKLKETDFNSFYNNLLSAQKELVLDVKKSNKFITFEMPAEGIKLMPNVLYLASTLEIIGSTKYASMVEGKSSLGRLGLSIHQTAGFIDVGFTGNVTLEFNVVAPLVIYPEMKIGQIAFYEVGEVDVTYDKKANSKYNNQSKVKKSEMDKNFEK